MSENLLKRISELETQIKGYEKLLKQANDKLLQLAGEISTDLEWAIKLQKKIVPTEMPRIKGFEFSSKFLPGSRFGGDYFDIFEHNDKWKFGIFLSSCSGYTVSSALMGLLIKYSTQVEAKRGMKPHEFLQVMSAELLPSFKDKDKASFFYATVDRKTLKLEYSSAGMISAYRQEVGADSVDYLNPIVPELSLGFKSIFTSNTISMEPQDRLVFSTPGLVTAASEKNEPWGVERMIEAWKSSSKKSVHEVRNEIFYQQQNFLKGNLPERDQSLIIVEVQEKIIKLA